MYIVYIMIIVIYYTQYQRYIVRMAEGFVAEGRPYRAVPELWTNRCFTHRRPVRPTGARKKIKYPTSILYVL